MHDAVVAASSTQKSAIPSDGADSSIVTSERSHKLTLSCVPDLKIAGMRTYTEKCAIAGPLHAGDTIVWSDIVQFSNLAGECRP